MSGRIFENIPQNSPEYSFRNLAPVARFLVTAASKLKGLAVRKPWVRAEFLGIIDFS